MEASPGRACSQFSAPVLRTPPSSIFRPPLSPSSPQVSKRGTVASRGGPPPAQTRAAYDAIEGRASSSTSTGQQQNFSPAPSSSSGPPVQEVSPVVNARMFRRMLTFAGIPIAVGLVGLPTAYYLKKVLGWDLPNYAVYAFQSLAWGGGLLGITYGILSSSWDPGFEGSALGITEAKANLGALVERGQRKREGK